MKRSGWISIGLGLMIAVITSCSEPDAVENSMETVLIGSQKWTVKNLMVTKFRNGEDIPVAANKAEWKKAADEGIPAYCYYEFDASNAAQYGALYNWYAVNDSRGLVPDSFRIARNEEWDYLAKFLGGAMQAGQKMKTKTGWTEGAESETTNESGFSAMPAGFVRYDGDFFQKGENATFWTATELAADRKRAYSRFITAGGFMLSNGVTIDKGQGVSVRCLAD